MTTQYATAYIYTDRGQNHIYTASVTDGTLTALTDVITGSGLEALAGQRIIKVMTNIEGRMGQGNGFLVVDPQNVIYASFAGCRAESQTPQWQHVNVGPLNLNWALKVNTLA